MTAKTQFWNRIAEKYAARPVTDEAAYQHKLQVTQGYLKPHMSVLEVGCGTGTTALKHAGYVKDILAIDFSEKMIEIARQRATAQHVTNVGFECQALEKLSHRQMNYDMIMAHSVLHLVEDLDATLNVLFLHLKPGGYLVTNTPCINDIMWFFKFFAPIASVLRIFPYVRCFGSLELIEKFKRNGFIIEYQWQANSKSALFMILQKPG